MIEGVKVDFGGAELVQHCAGRAEFHKAGAGEMAAKLEALPPDPEEKEATDESWRRNPTERVRSERKLASHKKKAVYFELVAGHLLPDEVYRLTGYELFELELAEDADY